MTQYNEFTRGAILGLHKAGVSARKIGLQLGKTTFAISRFLKTYAARGSLEVLPRRGRPSAFDRHDEIELCKLVVFENIHQPKILAAKLSQFRATPLTKHQVRTALARRGFWYFIRRKKPKLRSKARAKRLAWALENRSYPPQAWETIIFCDEKSVPRVPENVHDGVYLREKEKETERRNKQTEMKGGGSLPIWGGVTSKGLLSLHVQSERLTARRYCTILTDKYQPQADRLFPGGSYTLVHDNAKPHVADLTKEYCQQNGIDVLKIPPYSPDINIIENVWSELDRRLAFEPVPPNHSEHEKLVMRVWGEMQNDLGDYIHKLVRSLPDRIDEIIKNKGGHTNY